MKTNAIFSLYIAVYQPWLIRLVLRLVVLEATQTNQKADVCCTEYKSESTKFENVEVLVSIQLMMNALFVFVPNNRRSMFRYSML